MTSDGSWFEFRQEQELHIFSELSQPEFSGQWVNISSGKKRPWRESDQLSHAVSRLRMSVVIIPAQPKPS
jgi:hypothetical protein